MFMTNCMCKRHLEYHYFDLPEIRVVLHFAVRSSFLKINNMSLI